MTHVESNAIEHRLIVRYDAALTDEAAVVAAINKVVADIVR